MFRTLRLMSAVVLCASVSVQADSWLPPTTRTYKSDDGQWRLTVVPRTIDLAPRRVNDKLATAKTPSTPSAGRQQPTGLMERLAGGRWQTAWKSTLVNETSPLEAVVSAHGRAATFDNWHSAGMGGDAVVLYDTQGRKVRALALHDFLPKEYVCALPRSVSSIWWGGEHGFSADGANLVLRVIVPMTEEARHAQTQPDYVEISLDAATGEVRAPEAPAWNRALTAMRAVHAEEAENLVQPCLQSLNAAAAPAR